MPNVRQLLHVLRHPLSHRERQFMGIRDPRPGDYWVDNGRGVRPTRPPSAGAREPRRPKPTPGDASSGETVPVPPNSND